MLFNSLSFLIFFPVVTALFFLLPNRFRWILLLAASTVFYMSFIPAYIFILIITILIDYSAAILMEDTSDRKRRRVFLTWSIVSTCLVLFVFKYYDFFTVNVQRMSHLLGWSYSPSVLKLILPIGLSFHTFQSLSYVIEVYRGHQRAERRLGIYALYVMFYPQLVAGPIERPQQLLHQFDEDHCFEYQRVTNGLKLMAWGLFKKVVIADRLALLVNHVYASPTSYQGIPLIVATVFFAFQIYCDFSGYSDIAIGSAEVMGFKLMRNFNRPYFSTSLAEFWKRWHISLSTWFRDYLYISLGGNRVPVLVWYLNLFVTFVISGLWHGANWTYIVWGALNGIYLIIEIITSPVRDRWASAVGLNRVPFLRASLRLVVTFTLICFAWIFFRSRTLSDAYYVATHLMRVFSGVPTAAFIKQQVGGLGLFPFDFTVAVVSILFLVLMEILQARVGSVRQCIALWNPVLRWSCYSMLILLILIFGAFNNNQQFIYFQF